jgi:hypothetical protein
MGCFSKKICIILSIIIVLLGLGLGLGLGFGLRSENKNKTLAVSQITAAAAIVPKSSSSMKSALLPVTSLSASSNSFAFAQIEGLKFSVSRISISGVDGRSQSIDFASGEQVTLGSDGVAIGFEKSTPIGEGNYNRIEVQVKNTYSVKGYCKTNNSMVYTSTSGIKTIALASFNGNLPNYDYYEYPFAYPSIAQSPTDASQNTQVFGLNTYSNFTITSNSSLAILFDISYTVTCYDGISSNGFIHPFYWGTKTNSGRDLTDFFPTDKPNFGLHNLPLFGYVGNDYKSASSQTYGISSTTNAFSPVLDTNKFVIVTMAFKPDGSFLSASGRNENVNHLTSLSNRWQLKSATGDAFDFFNGAFYATGQVDVLNRLVSGFTKTTDLSSVRNFTVSDGPDCGKQFLEMNQNRAISCANAQLMSYWKRLG